MKWRGMVECMYVCLCGRKEIFYLTTVVCICVCMHAYVCACVRAFVFVWKKGNILFNNDYMYVCMYVCVYACMCACMCVWKEGHILFNDYMASDIW